MRCYVEEDEEPKCEGRDVTAEPYQLNSPTRELCVGMLPRIFKSGR